MEGTRFEVRLKPRAKGDRIGRGAEGMLDIAVTSPPVDDRANRHMAELLARRLGVSKGAIVILKGGHSRRKVVLVEGMTQVESLRRLFP